MRLFTFDENGTLMTQFQTLDFEFQKVFSTLDSVWYQWDQMSINSHAGLVLTAILPTSCLNLLYVTGNHLGESLHERGGLKEIENKMACFPQWKQGAV